MLKTLQNRYAHIILLLAMLMHLAAQISPLWMPSGDGLSIQICTTQGLKTIIVNEDGSSDSQDKPLSHPECSFCLASTAPFTATDVNLVSLVSSANNSFDGASNRDFLITDTEYSLSNPRAPPVTS